MSSEIAITAARLQADVPAAEEKIDDAIIALSTLMASVVTARRDTHGVSPIKGQAAIQRLAKAQVSLVDVSGNVLRVHGDLVAIGQETAGYDLHEACPRKPSASAPSLRAVS